MMTKPKTKKPTWIVQDVSPSGLPGPGFTLHETREEADAESDRPERRNPSPPFPAKRCETCGSVLGLEGRGLTSRCVDC